MLGAGNWCCRDCLAHRARVSSSSSNLRRISWYWKTGHADVGHILFLVGSVVGILGMGPDFGTNFGWDYMGIVVAVGCIRCYYAYPVHALGTRFVRALCHIDMVLHTVGCLRGCMHVEREYVRVDMRAELVVCFVGEEVVVVSIGPVVVLVRLLIGAVTFQLAHSFALVMPGYRRPDSCLEMHWYWKGSERPHCWRRGLVRSCSSRLGKLCRRPLVLGRLPHCIHIRPGPR